MAAGLGARVPASRVLLVSCFGAFLAFLDATIVNVAFPSIRESFEGSSIASLSWVLNAYNIVFAAFLVVCGRLTDLLGRRRAFSGGVVVFTLASAWCAAAGSLDVLVAGRVVQALGAAMLVPASLALVVEAFPGERRAHAIGLWGATAAVAAGLGPPLGGALVELGGWRWAFLVNLPFGVMAWLAARSSLVESRAPGRRVLPDLRGALLIAACLALVNLGLVKASDWGWGSARVIGAFVVGAALLVAFVQSSRRHRAPVVDPALVRIPSFGIASAATVVGGLGFYAYLLTNILWLQYVWGYEVLRAGLALVPGALVAAVVAGALGPLAERVGYRVLVVPGALVWASAYLWYHQQVGLAPDFWREWLPGQLLSGVGVGATLPLLGSAALAAVPGGRYATASALVSSARQLGGVLGISVLVLIVGTPAPASLPGALRDGWALSIGAFCVVALLALPLGRIAPVREEDDDEPETPLVIGPDDRRPAAVTQLDGGELELAAVPFLAGLPEAARAELAAAATSRVLEAGEWLFTEGEDADTAYVVTSGRLEVVIGDQLVREIGPGTAVGEIALLTGEPRSAGVRARRDAVVMALPREAFDRVLASDPAASRAVLTQVADQLRTASSAAAGRPVRPSVVAVVGTVAPDVGRALAHRLATHVRVVEPGRVDRDGLARAERDHDLVLLVSSSDEAAWREFCVRQADVVVLAERSDATPPESLLPPPAAGPEVVLVGPPPPPERRSQWVVAVDAWQLTLADGDLALGVRALADRLVGRSLGLVLAGGGARGLAHVGVLRELEEAGVRVDRVAGASIGSIVAATWAVGMSGEQLEETFYRGFVRTNPFGDWTLPTASMARGRRTPRMIAHFLGHDAVMDGLPRRLEVVSTDLVSRRRIVHSRGSLVDAVSASCRLPVLFPPIPTEEGQLLLDGGVLDNLPVDLMYQRDEGPVVAVNISMGGATGRSRGRRTGKPRIPALGETLLRTMMIGSGGAVAAARERGAALVTPATMGVGLLEFHQLDRMVLAGRQAARALLDTVGTDWLTSSSTDRVEEPEPA